MSICSKVKFLGNILSGEVTIPEQSKMQKILDFKQPVSYLEVKSFLGIDSFFRKFLP